MIDKLFALPGGFCEGCLGYVFYFQESCFGAGFVIHLAGTNVFFTCAALVVPSDKGKTSPCNTRPLNTWKTCRLKLQLNFWMIWMINYNHMLRLGTNVACEGPC